MTPEQLRAKGFVQVTPNSWVKMSGKFGAGVAGTGKNPDGQEAIPARTPKRLRQSSKPLMNHLEAEFFETIRHRYPNYPPVRPQAKTYRLASGVKYTPDFTASCWPQDAAPSREMAWEVKGKWFPDDAKVKLKTAAHEWPEVRFVLVWKESGQWREQEILA